MGWMLSMNNFNDPIIRQLGLISYTKVLSMMHQFTHFRKNVKMKDEIWLVQHPPVFTQGKSSKKNIPSDIIGIPCIKTDRGGKITYHGPGQQILYFMLDLRYRKINLSTLVRLLETIAIHTLHHFGIPGYRCSGLPGVYINKKKICSIGLRIKYGCSLHGLSINISMDITPFLYINPCGTNMFVTQMSHFIPHISIDEVLPILISNCISLLREESNNK
ncbi:lipoyl(octanoyl) transferase LipB [Candidatus Schneideria nysicola]|uniref:lipoyl(octanoyl) transferase LipB n=1 Tax=Candidatus Schneideria nysicola TaxID=1081631 RepID=UPI001FEA20F7|nr:lipoyl(octanoyl) transferase LipB [Candidatus Schneideria nysicola]